MPKKYKTIGILGGMGPMASANLYKIIIEIAQKKYGAEQDHDFPPIILYSLPLDEFDEKGFVDKDMVFKQLVDGSLKLQEAGADFIVMACNTVHYFQKQLQKELNIPLVSIIDETINNVRRSDHNKIGLMTSQSTRDLEIYSNRLIEEGYEIIGVTDEQQERLNQIILNIMGGKVTKQDKESLISIAQTLKQRGAESIVLGCTELPLLLNYSDVEIPLYNTLQIIADSALKISCKSISDD